MRRLDIVGGGAVGRTLGRLLHEAGATRIGRVAGRSLASAREAVAFIGAGEPGVDFDTLGRVDLLMLSVGDDAIGAVASALAASGAVLDGAVIFHCSGALSAEVLEPVRAKGACTASLHPVKTFAEPDAAATGFRGTYCGLEGDADALAALQPLVLAIGGVPFAIDGARKSLYHAGSVFACNYVTALIELGLRCQEQAGLARETAVAVLAPLAAETVANAFAFGPAAALTGPIARGDAGLVRRQLAALDAAPPGTRTLYARLGQVALELSRAQGGADPAALDELESALAEALAATGNRP
jgi:predicted short-subunit dehydrogenase-like oxidoreductase (DUF2520 family)